MSCIVAEWVDRGRSHYRSCYDERGKVCCRGDVREVQTGLWLVRVREGRRPPTSYGTWLSFSSAKAVVDGKLKGCGCTGKGLGRWRRT